jgi:protein-S-isoprenylcysteine O-methyltransferase Ste14
MLLKSHMVTSGNWLFRWRGYLPLVAVPPLLIAIATNEAMTSPHAFLGVGPAAFWLLGGAMVIIGLLGRILTVGFVREGTSGRNTAEGQVAAELNTTGFYATMRNPLYFFNCTIYMGVAVFSGALVLVPVIALGFALYYERIIAAEEDFLAQTFGQPYLDWAKVTPAFWPDLRRFTRPKRDFSLAMALVREHTTIFLGVFSLYALRLAFAYIAPDPLAIPITWHIVMALCVAGWLGVEGARKMGVLRPTER